MDRTMEFQSSAVVSLMPNLLLDVQQELLTARQYKLDKCGSLVKAYQEYMMEYEHLNQHCFDLKRRKEERQKKLKLCIENIKQEVYDKENEEEILRNRIQVVKQRVMRNIPDCNKDEELSDLIKKVCSLKEGIQQERKLFRQEVNRYQKGMVFYKKYLQCTVIGTDKETFSFTICPAAKSPSEACKYIKFRTTDGGISFQYVEMQPKLKTESSLIERFLETNDIQGLILAFWKAVKLQKIRRVLNERNSNN